MSQSAAMQDKLRQTTDINKHPPAISRVSRKSRLVAFETSHYRDEMSAPPEAQWKSNLQLEKS